VPFLGGKRVGFDDIFGLKSRVALVTGGGRGLGKTMALALAGAGADVAIADIVVSDGETTAAEVSAKGRKALNIPTDVSEAGEVSLMVDKAAGHFGKIDILVNNAGINLISPAEDFALKDWNKVLGVNLTGVFLCAQAVGRVMIKQKEGKIINVASMFGIVASPHGVLPYNTSKAGVINLTRSLAIEWGKYNIRVNAIAPGMIETELTRRRLQDQEYYRYFIDNSPLGRLGAPEDLIGAVIYLSSRASDWMTGQVMVVDGGFTAK
jgi:NAD(P)-dependent dehydrogenase (short-subunit alcohol dehydrogenase family)